MADSRVGVAYAGLADLFMPVQAHAASPVRRTLRHRWPWEERAAEKGWASRRSSRTGSTVPRAAYRRVEQVLLPELTSGVVEGIGHIPLGRQQTLEIPCVVLAGD